MYITVTTGPDIARPGLPHRFGWESLGACINPLSADASSLSSMSTSTQRDNQNRSADTPRLFEHQLDPALFTSDRLDDLCREADRRGSLKVQFADPGRQRYGNDPVYTRPSYPIMEDAMRRLIE